MKPSKKYQIVSTIIIMVILTLIFYFIQSIEGKFYPLIWQAIALFTLLIVSARASKYLTNR